MTFRKQIDSLRKNDSIKTKKTYRDYVVYGNDIFALESYRRLREKHGESNVLFLTSKNLSMEDILFMGPSLLRGEKNVQIFKEYFPEIEVKLLGEPSLFFKDGRYHSFHGRTKPQKFFFEEEFYIQDAYVFDYKKVFPEIFLEDTGEKLLKESQKITLKNIKKVMPSDLIERANYELHLVNGEIVTTGNLIFGQAPYDFYELCEDKKIFDDSFLKFIESTDSPAALYVKMIFSRNLWGSAMTSFIPISNTQGQGHFVGEFGENTATFVTFLVKEESSEEDIAKKIKLLKKAFEKIHPETIDIKTQEFIKLSEKSFSHKIDDRAFCEAKNSLPNLFFVSGNGTLKDCQYDYLKCEDFHFTISPLIRGLSGIKYF